MSKYKVSVYAICKNEEKFVDRWYESMKEADEIYVLDTGSTDNTVEELKKRGVNVSVEIIDPWRFDVARNKAMSMICDDADICICTDLDEVYTEGWRNKIEEVWTKDTNRLRHIYNWKLENGKPIVTFYYEKTHSRHGYKWIHPVHEVLKYELENEKIVISDEVILNHYPDDLKSRESYLPLLELSVSEEPLNDRNMHYLGREYMYYKEYNKAIDTLIKHLNLKSSTWKDERSASMRFIARCYQGLKRYDEVRLWLDKAINETPYLRDPLVERAIFEYTQNNWKEVEYYCLKALNITKREKSYINEIFSWDYTIYDLLSLSYYNQNEKYLALKYIDKALEMNKDDKRLITNKIIFEKM